jgi:hypothetical protein
MASMFRTAAAEFERRDLVEDTRRRLSVLRHPAHDGLFIALSFVHAGLLLSVPSIPLVAIGLWWSANTIAHNFIHLPFFHRRALNRLFSMFLSLLIGVPQSLWRARHLSHHAGATRAVRWTRVMTYETLLVIAFWTAWAALSPRSFLTIYLPGWLIGLGLCQLQGHYEHARGTTNHYGRIYNLLFFNDGYHAEHHAQPTEHWSRLPARAGEAGRHSRWPPVLRWLDTFSLEGLERLVLRSRRLQAYVLAVHERAFRRLLPAVGTVREVRVVGGGLFPRTALVLHRLLPHAAITVVDARCDHLETARRFLDGRVELVHETYEIGQAVEADLMVIPLSFAGDRRRVYDRPAARAVLVHDWIWRRHRPGVVVSWLLLKRVNLVISADVRRGRL